ncbi:fimbrial protein [Erwinia endophytica]|uniref:fimbrial protein n=1 Tax=Erwinia endophytica TaxID=1563158 RepID=UPI001F049F46|nr:fimbrial protein [Erwinia endophytica]
MRFMLKSVAVMSVCSALAIVPALSYADDEVVPVTVDGGTLNFEGSVVTAACALSSSSAVQSINMGQVRAASLATAGTTLSTGKDFTISLEDCDNSTYKNVAVTFSGTADANDATGLATGVNGGSGSAQNLSIRFYDETGTQINLNETSSTTALRAGSNTLNFTAKYHTEVGDVTSGDASAVATYTLTYS